MKKTWIFVTILFFSFESTQFSEGKGLRSEMLSHLTDRQRFSGSTGIFFQETDLILPQGTHNTVSITKC